MAADPDDVGILGRISLRMSVAVATGVASLCVMVAFVFLPDKRDIIVFAAALIGGAATVYSAFYAAATLRIQVRRDKQARAFEMIGALNEHQVTRLRVFIEKNIDDKHLTAIGLYDKIVEDAECLSIISAVLGVYEDMAVAVQEHFVDEHVLHRSVAFLIPWTFARLRPYIEQERVRKGDTRLYIELERLAESWKNGKYLSDGKAIPRGA